MAATKTKTSRKHAKLKELSATVKTSIYQMLKLADEILADPEYVEQFGGEPQLIDHLEANEFSHFGGRPSLAAMLKAYRKSPTESEWRQYKYNIQAMIELSVPRDNEKPVHVNWKARCSELEAEIASLKASLEDYQQVSADLRKVCDDLRAENGELRGQLKYLEKISAA